MSRRLLVFLVIDLVVIAALAAWWWNRRAPSRPAAVPPPAAVAAPAPTAVPPGGAAATDAETPAVGAPPPVAPAGKVELHGSFAGNPFWVRLGEPSPEFGGKRRLELVYTPPAPEVVSGSIIHDSPLLLVDDRLAVVEWNNRDGATGITSTVAPDGYKLVREVHGEGERIELFSRTLVGAPAWDLRLAPVLLALAWRGGEPMRAIRVVDFWGPRASEPLLLTIVGTEVSIGDERWTVEADADGRLRRLLAEDGSALLTVEGRP